MGVKAHSDCLPKRTRFVIGLMCVLMAAMCEAVGQELSQSGMLYDNQAKPIADLTIPAQLVAARHTILSAEIAAKIASMSIKEGQWFKEGQTLVRFDCTVQKARHAEAQAVLAAARNNRAAFLRMQELQSIGTLEVEKAITDLAVAEAKTNLTGAVLSKCVIVAPFSGRVVEKKAQNHQYVQAGQALLDILDGSSLEAEFIVSSYMASSMKRGVAVDLEISETGKTYTARIARVGAKIDAVSHSLKVVADIEGRPEELMVGMTGRVRLREP